MSIVGPPHQSNHPLFFPVITALHPMANCVCGQVVRIKVPGSNVCDLTVGKSWIFNHPLAKLQLQKITGVVGDLGGHTGKKDLLCGLDEPAWEFHVLIVWLFAERTADEAKKC